MGFQKVQEIQHQGCGNLFDLDTVWANAEPLESEHDQLSSAVAIRCNRIAAGVSFARQMLLKIRAEVHGPPAHLSEFGDFASFVKQCRSRFQIPVRVQRAGMTEEGGQSQHMPAWVCLTDIHVLQRSYGKVMTQVMQSPVTLMMAMALVRCEPAPADAFAAAANTNPRYQLNCHPESK